MSIKNNIKLLCLSLCSLLIGCSYPINTNTDTSDSEMPAHIFSTTSSPSDKTYKIVHIMSYHRDWEWTETQLAGFKDALSDLNVEYEVFALDAKNHGDDAWRNEKGREARALIDHVQPDLVYTSDDEAQEYVASYYTNTDLPFVFSTVNNAPETYGFDEAKNVTGIYEIEHFISTIELLTSIVPNIKKIAVIFDDAPIWSLVRERMQSDISHFPEIEFDFLEPISTYKAYQDTIISLQDKVDAICQVSIFNFKDESGNNVPFEKVLQWTEENSSLPDCSFWYNRVENGTLCSVAISGYEQGYAAGLFARDILVNHVSPSDLMTKPALKGQPTINLKRAKKLGLNIDSSILLGSTVLTTYDWED